MADKVAIMFILGLIAFTVGWLGRGDRITDQCETEREFTHGGQTYYCKPLPPKQAPTKEQQ